MPSNTGLVGRPRRRLTASVRARHLPCRLCGYPINQTLDRLRHPLGSVVDEWLPRYHGGDPLDPTNTSEVHRVCNGVKGKRWPVTDEMRAKCRADVERILAAQAPVTLTRW